MEAGLPSTEHDYLTTKELSAKLRISKDTLKRHFIAGKLKDLEWVDFFGDGKLKVTRRSWEAFEQKRIAATHKTYTQSAPASRG